MQAEQPRLKLLKINAL